MSFTAQFQVPSWEEATAIMEAAERVCQEHEGCKIVGLHADDAPACLQCGKPMVYNEELQTHVCSHPE